MALITTGNHPKALWPGVKAWFGASYDKHEEEWSKLFIVESSDKAWEEDVLMTDFGLAPVKNQGMSVSYTTHSQGYIKRYTNVTYGLGYIVTREEIEDNLYSEVSRKRAESLAFAMRQTKENVHANIFNRAFDSTYTGGDGSELCDTDHPSKAGTWQNELTTAADLSEVSLEDLCILVMLAENEMGNKINLMPQKLLVPPNLWFEANRVLKSTLQNDSANNAINALRSTNAFPGGIVVNHYLTDTDAYFVLTNCPRGLISYRRRPLEFTKDNDFDTENAKAKSTERYTCGWTDPRAVYGSPGA